MDSFSCLESERKRNENRSVGKNAYTGTKKVIWFRSFDSRRSMFDAVDVKSHQPNVITYRTHAYGICSSTLMHLIIISFLSQPWIHCAMCVFLLIFFVLTKHFFFSFYFHQWFFNVFVRLAVFILVVLF